MGGESSSVITIQQKYLLRAHTLTLLDIAGRARSFGLNTDSSHRFERGVDFK